MHKKFHIFLKIIIVIFITFICFICFTKLIINHCIKSTIKKDMIYHSKSQRERKLLKDFTKSNIPIYYFPKRNVNESKELRNFNLKLQKINVHAHISYILQSKDRKICTPKPTLKTYPNYVYIKLPAFKNSENGYKYYINSVNAEIIKSAKKNRNGHILIDLRDNTGGFVEVMLKAITPLVPNGAVLSEIDKSRHAHILKINDYQITGGIKNSLSKYSSYSEYLSKKHFIKNIQKYKIAVITNRNTASAAEYTLLALKNNPNTRTFGEETFGATSATILKRSSIIPTIYLQLPVGWLQTNEGTLYDNKPIQPDIKTAHPVTMAEQWLQN